jgi:hypothetical protein
MPIINFYSSNTPEYMTQKWHYNLGNQFVHSDLYKKLNVVRQNYDFKPNQYTQMPYFLGHVPQLNWVYGNLDYSYRKYHRHFQAHDDWYPDRKNKTLGHKNGGFCDPTRRQGKYMTLIPTQIPRGCAREIRKYQMCTKENGAAACFNDKISIMEVCPDHILEGLREKKKHMMRAELIDNQTYRRAMQVGDYNKGRSVADLELKTWAHGKAGNLRSDSYWEDDRYNPKSYRHHHRNDNVNNPEQEYKDFFGGNIGEGAKKEKERHQLGFFSDKSKAMADLQEQKRENSISSAASEVAAHNKED